MTLIFLLMWIGCMAIYGRTADPNAILAFTAATMAMIGGAVWMTVYHREKDTDPKDE